MKQYATTFTSSDGIGIGIGCDLGISRPLTKERCRLGLCAKDSLNLDETWSMDDCRLRQGIAEKSKLVEKEGVSDRQ